MDGTSLIKKHCGNHANVGCGGSWHGQRFEMYRFDESRIYGISRIR